VAGGGTLQLMAGWHTAAAVKMEREWSVDEIGQIIPDLFRGRPRKLECIPIPGPISGE